MRKTAIIIVNYRTPGLVVDCLHSLQAEVRAEPDCRVIVVDNASGDDSVAHLRTAIRAAGWTWAELLPLERNGGFAFGNNAAIRPLLQAPDPPAYFHLLNPDTYVRPGAVSRLIDFLEAHPTIGIAGSRLENPDGSPQRAAFRFHGVLSELERGLRFGVVSKLLQRWMVAPPPRSRPHKTDWANGASLMIRREVFDSIGLMDEGFFLYYEETDFCLRAREAGWPCWFVPASRVVHLEGQSTGATGTMAKRKRVPPYWFASRRRYFRKHYGPGYEFVTNVVHAGSAALFRVRRWLQFRDEVDTPHYLSDFVKHTMRGL
jgi:N-acetylglucosaminyl-diphospho-decaprenol L-rhamnosyltransferase